MFLVVDFEKLVVVVAQKRTFVFVGVVRGVDVDKHSSRHWKHFVGDQECVAKSWGLPQ